MISTLVDIGVSPIDKWNTQLLDNVHPPNWVDAEPDGVSERHVPCICGQRRRVFFIRVIACRCVRLPLVKAAAVGKV